MMVSGCSTLGGSKSASNLSVNGPSIVAASATPPTIDLNTNLQADQAAQIFADVKDFTAPVKTVKARFIHIPIELNMDQLAGTTWAAQLTPEQLKELAVAGQTMKYAANIVATDANGNVAISPQPVNILVKAPDASRLSANLRNTVPGYQPSEALPPPQTAQQAGTSAQTQGAAQQPQPNAQQGQANGPNPGNSGQGNVQGQTDMQPPNGGA